MNEYRLIWDNPYIWIPIFFILIFLVMMYLFSYEELEINKYDSFDEYMEHIKKEHPDIYNEFMKDEDDKND